MKKSRFGILLLCGVTAVMMLAGLYAIAVEYGGQNDPLVTLSYINQVVLPETRAGIDSSVNSAIGRYESDLQAQTAQLQAYVDQALKNYSAGAADSQLVEQIAQRVVQQMGGTASGSVQWAMVPVPAGKTVVCEVGCQAVLCSGAAVCVASGSPGLVDVSDAGTLSNGGAVLANHLYTVTVQGHGIRTANGCTLLISGGYTIS
ncbi:MAG: hypothetical protein IK141_03880 [Clostridia bacterium]|nr:hypothetical protein [Clostridia bacterium]